ncbi:MAG: hypothetical protein FJ034_07995, partial [Chloroflexi bacterium]|nr:hypothetical protein [Chloroflexota bacterium]
MATRKRFIGIALAGILGGALVSGAVAGAATDSVSGIATIAQREGGAKLAEILKGLVDKGTITQAQADAVKAALEAARPALPPRGPGIGRGANLESAAAYLGMTLDALRTQLSSGKSLAEVAAATAGKTRDGLIAAMVQAENARIDKAVADGKMTAQQAT